MKKNKVPTKKEIEENFEQWKSAGREKIAAVRARNELLRQEKSKKEAKFTARLTLEDFDGFKSVAEKKGIPYQTLLSSVIHGYINGHLVDVEEIRKVIPGLKLKKKAG
ncbi:hypothetical protein [Bdellovibrio sp. BCCA]|uniref:hypothetical protein n=1 Tax=Bdellovibrio sp. BCCA TaxID=3136281 RepID=UPI0030EFFA76